MDAALKGKMVGIIHLTLASVGGLLVGGGIHDSYWQLSVGGLFVLWANSAMWMAFHLEEHHNGR